MKTAITLGKSGRLVIPKRLPERLGLREGTHLSIQVLGGIIQMEPLPDEVRIDQKDGFPVLRGGPPRKKDQVVDAIKADREARDERIVRRK